MAYIIDSHEDLAFNYLNLGRDYRISAFETRRREAAGTNPQRFGDCLIGWEEYQRGQVAVVFGTLYVTPGKYNHDNEKIAYYGPADSEKYFQQEVDYYRLLDSESPEKFRLILNRADLKAVLSPWEKRPADFPNTTHPVGIVILMEGAEAIGEISEMEKWWQAGVRVVGPVWAGTRFCGGTIEHGGFTAEGYQLLKVMAELGFTLDISHMTERSCLEALDSYSGPIIASHANARAHIENVVGERHLTDATLSRLIARKGVVGVLPFNRFLKPNWEPGHGREAVTLEDLLMHIDHICQLAGNARHVALGTDFDGGFGYPSVPLELNTIADLQKIGPLLEKRGYSREDIGAIFSGNWKRHLENHLPV